MPTGQARTAGSSRTRQDFYNLALTQVLSGAGAEGVANLQGGRYDLPFGTVDVTVDQASLMFAGRTLTSFVPTMNLKVKGFKNDYRSDGIGAPLAAGLAPAAAAGQWPRAAGEPAHPDLGSAADGRPAAATHRVAA